ncbi:redox-sensing transcriptional repressor Rex [Deinococcus peraridilitoris]|uniref:Redox-sensing transcriptional repressor Rex n=1 Tax=Deinococcus peraridilitoris (strain DSM 19664 / LMG 22246 / CIP 109416 / KR-200) TaxID=937777 RepID=L0A511_DEIPD|nr:redox-sensing transcriptional repressor Rex [Deinococcus peraridilitoris]AFZ68973.1 AT-rich DNA-binding protein [Deinococcus peraridilitoris DSM 19664]
MSSGIPSATISRLVTYLRILENLEGEGISRTSSTDLAERAQVSAFQVRKDLAYFGRFGTRGMGYTVPVLKRELMRVLGLTQAWNVVILGIGRLGEAIANYPGASEYAFSYVGLFDVAEGVVGKEVRGLNVRHVSELAAFATANHVDMGFLAVPPEKAQDAAQMLVEAGVKGILNFAPVVLQPRAVERHGASEIAEEWRGVIVENVDFLAGMKRLAFYILNPHLRDLEPEETA